ncbi:MULTISPECIES: alpha/beta hydrolase [unclassified Haladaptatus]|uniref:alpha/beta hydrolase n=1 Tax=unclassified Haladaptatus TaxID=2622732 RepID=UPI0023E8BF31|nr:MULTISPECIES: dienelactone hydrolase family protein [unclassified Haladaptatus]
MTGEPVLIPGARDVRATHDTVPDATSVVVACPPHPQQGGKRTDSRLTAVSEELAAQGIATLRFDYGAWDEGRGEREDARNAVAWAQDHYEHVGLFGFSFGGAIALLTAAGRDDLAAVSALAPAGALPAGLDVAASLSDIAAPTQVVFASRDTTANWEPVVERARELDFRVDEMSADHFFIGQKQKVAALVCDFLVAHL